MAGPANDQSTVMRRRALIEELWALLMSHDQIVREVRKQFQVSERTVRRDLGFIVAAVQQDANSERPKLRDRMRASLRRDYQRAMAAKDYRAAATFKKLMIEIDGLKMPDRVSVEHSGSVEVDAVTTGDRRSELDKILAKVSGLVAPANGKPANGANGHGGNGAH